MKYFWCNSKKWRAIFPVTQVHFLARKWMHFSHATSYLHFSDDLKILPAQPNELRNKPPVEDLGFGKHFTDHMLRIKWSADRGWEAPVICKLENFSMHPAAKVNSTFCLHWLKMCHEQKEVVWHFSFCVRPRLTKLDDGMKATWFFNFLFLPFP